MANTLTNLIPDLYSAMDVVSRELVGFIPAVTLDAQASRAAVGQTVRSPVAPAASAADITPGQLPPDTGDQTIGNKTISISKSRAVPIRWNGEEQLGLNNNGAGYETIFGNQLEQAIRTLVNEMESDLAALHTEASRAVGTAGATPFATAGNYTDASLALKVLKDNGATSTDRHLILDTAAGANLIGKQADANRQGSDSMLRQGVLLDHAGFMIRESGQVETSTAGTASSATTDNAGYSVGDTVITLASAGTGTIVAGDVITFNGDSNQYVVASGDSDVSNGGTITLAAPGLRQAIAASTTAITVKAAAARSMAFTRNAIALAARVPARPKEGDSANDVMIVTDPRSGVSFELAMYGEYRQVHFELSAAWGVAVMKPEHCAILLG